MNSNNKMTLRREQIMNIIRRSPITTVNQLAHELCVSKETIRKDIQYLAERDLILRIHGGVSPKEISVMEPTYNSRSTHNLETKQRIAAAAFQTIHPGESILLESGTTVQELARLLVQDAALLNSLCIITLSFHITEIFKDSNLDKLYFLGGRVRKNDMITYGHYALSMLQDFHIDKAFIGAAAIDNSLTITDYFDEEVHLRRQIISASDETVLLIDSSKMNKTAFFTICNLEEIRQVITDAACPREMTELFTQRNIPYTLA